MSIVLMLSSVFCTPQKTAEIVTDDYEHALEAFGSFVDHFPKTIDSASYFLLSEEKFVSHPKLWLKATNVDRVESIKKSFAKKAVGSYESSDTCLLVIEYYLKPWDESKFDRRNMAAQSVHYNSCSLGKLPIPKFWEHNFLESNSLVGLDSGYIFYLLDAQPIKGAAVDKLPNGRYAPGGWEHGYSKGVAINKNKQVIIYWFDAW